MLALGGGAVLDEGTRGLLAGLPVAYLSMDVEEAVRRVGLGAARPLLAVNPRRQWRELMEPGARSTPKSRASSCPPTTAPPQRSPRRSSTHWS